MIVIQATLLAALQVQALDDGVTLTLPVLAAAPGAALAGDSVKVHGALTVTVVAAVTEPVPFVAVTV